MVNAFNPATLMQNLSNPEKAPKGKIQAQPDEKGQTWPSWRYGPDGKSTVCAGPEDVPKGWLAHPKDFESKKALDL